MSFLNGLPQIYQIIFFISLTFIFSLILTWKTRQYSIRKGILDIPNERSSHQIPTPRGGGIAIVVTYTLSILGLVWMKSINPSLAWTIIIGGNTIAFVGFIDDLYSIPPHWRFLFHLGAAGIALYCLGGFSTLGLGKFTLSLHIGFLFALIVIVTCINFYNFMDGIDGLAGCEGIFVALISGISLWLAGAHHIAMIPWLLAASIAGFTFWNWPPAKIFLGDVGSGYLGFIFAILCLYTANNKLLPILFWEIISAVFLCDASFTLIYRIYEGKKWYKAHREHAYQCLASHGIKHKNITLYISIINLLILAPIAFVSLFFQNYSFLLTIAVTLGLLFVWIRVKARFKPITEKI